MSIVYLPLDINIPDIDVDKLIKWHNSERTVYENWQSAVLFNNLDPEKYTIDIYKQLPPGSFWVHGFCINEYTYKEFTQANRSSIWVNEFDQHFPELVEVFSSLPNSDHFRKVGFIYEDVGFTSRKQLPAPVHIDEKRGLATRIVLNADDDSLFFHKFTDEYIESIQNGGKRSRTFNVLSDNQNPNSYVYKDGERQLTDNVHSEKHYAKYPHKNCAFIMNSETAAHSVEAKYPNGNPKVTFIVMNLEQWKGGYVPPCQYDELIQRSMNKYSDYAILH